jgi:two-component system OmpR family response regulator
MDTEASPMSRTILLVDANAVFLTTLSTTLRAEGYEVITAADGSAAVSAARSSMPDLIIINLFYPPDVSHGGGVSWDGFLIMEWIKRMADFSRTRVIFTTDADAAQYVDRARKAGASGLFQKGPDMSQLVSVIHRFLGEPTPAA